MAKSEAEIEMNRVNLVLWQWKKPISIEKFVFQCCLAENRVFLIYMKLEGWTAGVWRWMILSHGSQRPFLRKTAVKALDRDLGFV